MTSLLSNSSGDSTIFSHTHHHMPYPAGETYEYRRVFHLQRLERRYSMETSHRLPNQAGLYHASTVECRCVSHNERVGRPFHGAFAFKAKTAHNRERIPVNFYPKRKPGLSVGAFFYPTFVFRMIGIARDDAAFVQPAQLFRRVPMRPRHDVEGALIIRDIVYIKPKLDSWMICIHMDFPLVVACLFVMDLLSSHMARISVASNATLYHTT